MSATKLDAFAHKKICIQACLDAYHACQTTALHLYSHAMQDSSTRVQLLLDCAAMCQANADFMRGDSDLQRRFSEACAEICLRCSQECARFASDVQMKLCASACRRCAESCQQIMRKPLASCSVPGEMFGGGDNEFSHSSRL